MGSDGTNFIGGVWPSDAAGEIKPVHSPIDGLTIGTMTWSSRQAAIEAIAAARRGQPAWRKVSTWDRAKAMRRIGEAIAARRAELAALLTLEQGKPCAEAFFEVGKSVDGFNLAADLVKYLEGNTIPTEDPTKRVMTVYRPRGEIAADNRYGLVSSVFTQDIDRAFRYIEEMPTGIVNINDMSNYWELHISFGGMSGKDSGTGRVGGRHALTAMCDLKTATFSVK